MAVRMKTCLCVSLCFVALSCLMTFGNAAQVSLFQITATQGGGRQAHGFPATNWDGTRIVFQSNQDLTPNNPPGLPNQLFDIFLWDENEGFRRITNTSQNYNLNAVMSADGATVAFHSTADLAPGQPGHPNPNFEVYCWKEDTGITQITNSLNGFSAVYGISTDGSTLSILSNGDLTPNKPGNPYRVDQVYLWRDGQGLTQITSGRFTYFVNGMSADGRVLAMVSDADLTPGEPGNPNGNLQIFTWTQGTGFKQITNSTLGVNERPTLSPDGESLVFRSTDDLTPGNPGNPKGNPEIFLWREGTGFKQITAADERFGSDYPVINAEGVVAFMSNADLTPGNQGNPNHNFELYIWKDDGGIRQITATGRAYTSAQAISGSGVLIPFVSNADLTGDNPNGDTQMFQAVVSLDK